MKLSRWGNSIGMRLPRNVVETVNLKEGDEILVRVLDSGNILVTPIRTRPGAAVSDGDKVARSPAKEGPEKW